MKAARTILVLLSWWFVRLLFTREKGKSNNCELLQKREINSGRQRSLLAKQDELFKHLEFLAGLIKLLLRHKTLHLFLLQLNLKVGDVAHEGGGGR
jgi:hypothetical protein